MGLFCIPQPVNRCPTLFIPTPLYISGRIPLSDPHPPEKHPLHSGLYQSRKRTGTAIKPQNTTDKIHIHTKTPTPCRLTTLSSLIFLLAKSTINLTLIRVNLYSQHSVTINPEISPHLRPENYNQLQTIIHMQAPEIINATPVNPFSLLKSEMPVMRFSSQH